MSTVRQFRVLAAAMVAVMVMAGGALAQSTDESLEAERKALEAEKRALEAEKRLLDVERRVLDVDRKLDVKTINYDFTAGERWGTWAVNWLVPGLGSGVIMHDATGVYVQVGLSLGGYIFILGDNGSGGAATLGILMLTGSFVYNIVRSSTYHRPTPTMSANVYDGFNIAVLPDKDGNFKGYAFYSTSF
jgi:hypothetical protein